MSHPFIKSAIVITQISAVLLIVGALNGCGNDAYDPGPAHPVVSDSSVSPAQNPLPAQSPEAVNSDPLASSSDPLAGGDPMASTAGQLPSSLSDGNTEPLSSGPTMPTDHSHWLVGDIMDAKVDVSLNGDPFGEYDAPVDEDITMHLRRGINTVTFSYTPTDSSSSASMQVLESEHTPPIPPLVIFRSPQVPLGQTVQSVTKTFTFIAH